LQRCGRELRIILVDKASSQSVARTIDLAATDYFYIDLAFPFVCSGVEHPASPAHSRLPSKALGEIFAVFDKAAAAWS